MVLSKFMKMKQVMEVLLETLWNLENGLQLVLVLLNFCTLNQRAWFWLNLIIVKVFSRDKVLK